MKWITKWAEVEDDTRYLCCAVHNKTDGSLGLSHPIQFQQGWQVKRLMEGCYAVIDLPPFAPPFDPLPPAPAPAVPEPNHPAAVSLPVVERQDP
jgi:hypothetical protein